MYSCPNSRRYAFTLIELLVVVAIIAILAAIAVVNIRNALVRSKVSRARADLRTIQMAVETYAVDENSYPLNAGGIGLTGALFNLLSPRSYLEDIPRDVFARGANTRYFYLSGGRITMAQENAYGAYALASVGPDGTIQTSFTSSILYDPTNGTISRGDIVVTSRADPPEPEQL